MSRWAPLLAAAATLFSTRAAVGHEFWIEPSAYHVKPGEVVRVGLRVGDGFPGEPVPRDPGRIVKFVLAGPDGERPIAGVDGADPAGLLRVENSGLFVIGYRSARTPHELPGPAFETYLSDDGLEHVSAARKARGQTDQPGREVFSRCAKALLRVGDGPATGFDRRLDFTLELVPRENPFALRPGDTLSVAVLHEGRLLQNALVVARCAGAADRTASARSDSSGIARFAISAPGRWLISAVHMVPAPPGVNADWESFWASLSFELAPDDE
ncbi:MAG: DUF4198 domain-containing protein [Phycisphaerae bacterium]|jgi:uncharacterized GH25 family protein